MDGTTARTTFEVVPVAAGKQVRKPLMTRVNEKVAEQIVINKGTAWLIGSALTIAPIVLMILFNLLTGAMGYQSNISRIDNMDKRLESVEKAIAGLTDLRMSTLQVQNDVQTIKNKQAEADADRKQMVKDVGDIRILLAQGKIREAQ